MNYKEYTFNEIKNQLENTPPVTRKATYYLISCSMQKVTNRTSYGAPYTYYKFNSAMTNDKALEYISFLYQAVDNTDKNDIINDLVDIHCNLPAFPNEINSKIIVGKYKYRDVKVDIWNCNKWNSIASIYLAKFITNIGFHAKYGSGLRKKIVKIMINLGFI